MSDTVNITEVTETVQIAEGANVETVTVQDEAVEIVEVGIQGPAGTSIYVADTPPGSPQVGSLWVDTSA